MTITGEFLLILREYIIFKFDIVINFIIVDLFEICHMFIFFNKKEFYFIRVDLFEICHKFFPFNEKMFFM